MKKTAEATGFSVYTVINEKADLGVGNFWVTSQKISQNILKKDVLMILM